MKGGEEMHIPDGWVDPFFLMITWIVTIIIIMASIRKMKDIDETRLTYMAVLAGTIFAAQMLNFPILGGTSGHLLGGALAASIVGLWGGCLVISVVLIIQAFLFADGGIIALGANIFNMAIVGVFVAYLILRFFMINKTPKNRYRYYGGVFLGSFLSVIIASVFAAIEIGIPVINSVSQVNFADSFLIILFYHLLIGIGEGIITLIIVSYFNTIQMNIFFEINNPSTTHNFSKR
ncbi:cobalamin biosynthesis protein CbiM [Candidatus Heimdallarchaeota archaeon B3_Heim]|nr:MAG: cobalamin biosynthesis protein CbiM [Candidatus Heimdallarchaeota archaeon B3_Heim]